MKQSSFTKDLIGFKSDLSELGSLKYAAQGLVEDIGVRISLARTQQGLSQKELAKRARIDQGDVSRIENGEIATTVFTLGKLLHVLDLNLEILTLEQQKKITALPVQKAKKPVLSQKMVSGSDRIRVSKVASSASSSRKRTSAARRKISAK